MAKPYYVKPTRILHKTFDSLEIGDEFTGNMLFELAYGEIEEYQTEKYVKKVTQFVHTQIKNETGTMEKTSKIDKGRKGRKCGVYRKLRNMYEYETIPIKDLPDEYTEFLKIWNNISYGIWVTCEQFKKMCGTDNSKLVSAFLYQLVYNKFSATRIGDSGYKLYRKLHVVPIQTMVDKFVILRKKLITDDTQLPQKKETQMAKPIEQADVPLEDIGAAIVEKLVNYRHKIVLLTKDNKGLQENLDTSTKMVDSLKAEKLRLETTLSSRNKEIEALKEENENLTKVSKKTVNLSELFDGRAMR